MSTPDQQQRDAAIFERQRNVLIDAGAGTGKTTTLVLRLVEQVAPAADLHPATPIDRIAAVTFTRKAAGELRLRIRQQLLQELARAGLTGIRRQRLSAALSGLDSAYIGTTHSFADRLLRLRPMEAALSPSYEIAEETESLTLETYELLLHASETGVLAQTLGSAVPAARAAEAQRTLLDCLAAGLRPESFETEFYIRRGLDNLVEALLLQRDAPLTEPAEPKFDRKLFVKLAGEFIERARAVTGDAPGSVWVRRAAARLERMVTEKDPVVLFRELGRVLHAHPKNVTQGVWFAGDDAGWEFWKAFNGDKRKKPVRASPLRDDLELPLHQWLAERVVRLLPVVEAAYEQVKARHQAVDQIDLLLKLRNLLRDDKESRRHLQSLFDHLFVDEFQDTDPLQAEIFLFLAEKEPKAKDWREVVLADGKLTVVGDPKQSIYRFRRADIAMYDEVRSKLAKGKHLPVRLSANFRSVPGLIDWLNSRFEDVLGTPPAPGAQFDLQTGRVFHQPLEAGCSGAKSKRVHALQYELKAGKGNVGEYRLLEAEALSKYLRWLVEVEKFEIRDPLSGAERPVEYGDIAVLTVSTFNVGLLFTQLDAMGVPYSSRGGKLFLEDPLHRQFLLALRAVADRDDGVAEAALLRPPFFAIDSRDLFLSKAEEPGTDPGVLRVQAARAQLVALRRERGSRPPGATARDLLEQTGFGRMAALGPNGLQRLERLRELCLVLERIAAVEGLDFDAATARMRDWVDEPVQLEAPHPVASQAVQVMTVHQAKGLEFPVVVFQDGCAQRVSRNQDEAWYIQRGGAGWALKLEGLEWEQPRGVELLKQEREYRTAERARVVYVAATRARDLLVLPKAGDGDSGWIASMLLESSAPEHVEHLEPYKQGAGASWSAGIEPPAPPVLSSAGKLENTLAKKWQPAAEAAGQARFTPTSVSGEASSVLEQSEEDDEAVPKPRVRKPSRFGAQFGETVHLGIGLCLKEPGLGAAVAVKRAAKQTELAEHLKEAEEDVARALKALEGAGLLRELGETLRIEYPIVGSNGGGKLLLGYVDLLSMKDGVVTVIDFKTDAPPAVPVETSHPQYVGQVQSYAKLLGEAGIAGKVNARCGLLFTADGEIRWALPLES